MGTSYGSKVGAAGKQQNHNRGLQPSAAGAGILWLTNSFSIDSRFDHYRSGRQQHGIYRSEIVILSVKNKEYCEAGQVAPAQKAVGFEAG